MEKQRIENRSVNYVNVALVTEGGCNPKEGEYSLHVTSFIGLLDICSAGGCDDVSLIRDCVENKFDFDSLLEECTAEIIVKESGEWEDVFWHKYYEIECVFIHPHA